MVPILYAANETAFTSNGLGRLVDCIECLATEERNSVFEVSFKYPVNGRHYADIQEGCYICCTHDDDKDAQPFEIYRRSAPIDGIVQFSCRHLSYKLSNVILEPFTASNISDTMTALNTKNINTNPFSFWTDKTTVAPFALTAPASVRAAMGGVEGSILDVYGGEYKYDKWTVKLYANRGNNSGVTIRYAKNLTDLVQTKDASGLHNAVVPYWIREDENGTTLVMLPEKMITAAGVTDPVPVALDLSMELPDEPTEAELRAAAQEYLTDSAIWTPTENLTVDFVQLWQTTEYEGIANLQRVRLCDTVDVYYPALGVTAHEVKVIKTVYDVLADKYAEIELGQPQASFADTLNANFNKQLIKTQEKMQGFFDAAIEEATDLLTGANGGHVVIKRNSNGEPQEILILDTTSELTATNILRINLNGIGFSTNGGTTYSTAWTINGDFVANFITSGQLRAIKIQGPRDTTTQTTDPENTQYPTFWDLATGILQSFGRKTVTSHIYNAVTSYGVTTKTRIDTGEFNVTGKKNGDTEETTFADLGILSDVNYTSVNNVYMPDLPGVDTMVDRTYPRGELDLRGHKMAIPCGAGSSEDPDGTLSELAGKAYPLGKISTDRIDIGSLEEYARDDGQSIGGYTPARNTLSLHAGWNDFKDSIVFTKRFQASYSYDNPPELLKTYYNTPLNCRPAWEIVPGEVIEIDRLYTSGWLTSDKKTIVMSIPMSRPFSPEVVSIRIESEIFARQGSTLLLDNASIDSDTSSGLDYPRYIHFGESNIAFSLHHSGSGSWSSGTAYGNVSIQLENIIITPYDYDYYDPGGSPE